MTKTMSKRNILISVGVLFAAIVTGCILWIYYMAPSSYLALDVNPSIEIHTNRLNQVTSIEPVNEDAKQIMAGYVLTDRNLETVIHNIVDRIILGGFLAPNLDNTILVSTDDSSSSSQISDTVNTIITNYLAEKQLSATVIPQSITVTSQSIEEAHDNYVSIGKMALIQELIANDSTLTVEQLSTQRISDLVLLAESKNISLAGLFYSASNTSNVIQEDASTDNNDALIDIEEEDNDLNEKALEASDNEDQEDNDLEDSDDGNNNDQDDKKIEIHKKQEKIVHEKSKIEDREDNDNEDQEDKKIEDREDNDNEDQQDSKFEDREDSDNDDQEDNYFEDREDNDNEDQQSSYHIEQKSNDREDQNEGDNED